MRVFFLTYAYERGVAPDSGGFRKPWELARALQTLGHEVLVFYPALPGSVPLRQVPAERYLLYVGTVDRRKDYATLLQALLQLDQEISLVLAGTLIEGRTDFPQMVERLGLRDRVRFLGCP